MKSNQLNSFIPDDEIDSLLSMTDDESDAHYVELATELDILDALDELNTRFEQNRRFS